MMCLKKTMKYSFRYGSLFLLGILIPLILPGLLLNSMAIDGPVRIDRIHRADEDSFAGHQTPGKLNVHLYFATRDNAFLTAEQRGFIQSADPAEMGTLIIDTLVKGPRHELMPTLPAQTSLRAIYIGDDGTAYVDFSENIRQYHCGGVQTERLSVFSIVNSLILNIPEITAVKILIGGKDVRTLAGHIDLRFPFKADMLLIR